VDIIRIKRSGGYSITSTDTSAGFLCVWCKLASLSDSHFQVAHSGEGESGGGCLIRCGPDQQTSRYFWTLLLVVLSIFSWFFSFFLSPVAGDVVC
jgi:hypothetical protein